MHRRTVWHCLPASMHRNPRALCESLVSCEVDSLSATDRVRDGDWCGSCTERFTHKVLAHKVLARSTLAEPHSLTLSLMHRKKDIYNKEHEKAAVVGSHQLCSLPSEGSRSVFLDATFGGINL